MKDINDMNYFELRINDKIEIEYSDKNLERFCKFVNNILIDYCTPKIVKYKDQDVIMNRKISFNTWTH